MADKEPDTVTLNVPDNTNLLIKYDRDMSGGLSIGVFDKDSGNKLATLERDPTQDQSQALEITGKGENSTLEIRDNLRNGEGKPLVTIKTEEDSKLEIDGPHNSNKPADPMMDLLKKAYEQFIGGTEDKIANTQKAFDEQLQTGMDPQMAMAVAEAKLDKEGLKIARDPNHHDQTSIQSPAGLLQGIMGAITNQR